MSRRDGKLPKLGEVELAALQYLWQHGEAGVADVHASIGSQRGISANTVGSALERLFKKELVARRKVSHAFVYRAAMSSDEFAARRVLEATDDVRLLSKVGLLSAFVDLVAEEDAESLDRLEQLIADKRRGRQ